LGLVTQIRSDWDWEATKEPPRSSSQAVTQSILEEKRLGVA